MTARTLNAADVCTLYCIDLDTVVIAAGSDVYVTASLRHKSIYQVSELLGRFTVGSDIITHFQPPERACQGRGRRRIPAYPYRVRPER